MVGFIPKILLGAFVALGTKRLDQTTTNGDCDLGTLEAPTYPLFLGDEAPWPEDATVANSHHSLGYREDDHYGSRYGVPNTGVTRKYKFVVSKRTIAPDGVEKEAIVVNGGYPGPTIVANWGDWIEVEVTNRLKDEGTSLHWHGILHQKTKFMDGVPSVHQCPIAPKQTFTYRFRADQYGTSWWHAHYSGQYPAGLIGPMIIFGPQHDTDVGKYDVDLGPILLNDWFHKPHQEIIRGLMGTKPEEIAVAVTSQNNLINGKNVFSCELTQQPCVPGAPTAQFRFQSGKRHRLRLINSGAEAQQEFSIDGHELTVIAVDYVPVEPYTVSSIQLANGQRADVIVNAIGDPSKSYFMRSTMGCTATTQPNALASVHYENADITKLPTSSPNALINDCTIDAPIANIRPKFVIPAFTDKSAGAIYEETITMEYKQNSTKFFLWAMNEKYFRANYNRAILSDASETSQSPNVPFEFPESSNVIEVGNDKKYVRIVLLNKGFFDFFRHPMHLHGHDMQVLAVGKGQWDGKIVNPENPLRRDTQIIPGQGFLVLQYEVDNAGIWPLHCHIAWHSSQGLYVNILEGPAEIRKKLKAPQEVKKGCRTWGKWTKYNVVPQIDVGV